MSRSNHFYFNMESDLLNREELAALEAVGKAYNVYSPRCWRGEYFTVQIKPERLILGRRTWRRKKSKQNRLYKSAPGWYRTVVNRLVRRRLDADIAAGREPEDWHRWGGGRIGWYY